MLAQRWRQDHVANTSWNTFTSPALPESGNRVQLIVPQRHTVSRRSILPPGNLAHIHDARKAPCKPNQPLPTLACAHHWCAPCPTSGITQPFPIQVSHPAGHPGRSRRARPRQDRQRQDAGVRHSAGQPARRRPRDGHATLRPGAGTHPRAGHPDHRGARATGRRPTGLRVTTIFGGVPQNRQVQALQGRRRHRRRLPGPPRGPDAQRLITLDAVEITVIDEADHMADLGFLPGVTRILTATPGRRSAPAVLGDAGQRRRQAGQAVPAQRGVALGRLRPTRRSPR